jgi:hypothetical protein
LPGTYASNVEAAARIIAIHTILTARAHAKLMWVAGKGRRPAEALEVARW